MEKKQFEESYSEFYDLLYQDKEYDKEALFIDSLIKELPHYQPDLAVLDLACGTGKHLLELSKIGFNNLSGSDIAESMVKISQERFKVENRNASFYNYSFQNSNRIIGKFDVIISMFSAINYLTSYEDQLKSFKNINGLLNKDGVFIFDYWNGNAVIDHYSPVRVLKKRDAEKDIMRISQNEINRLDQLVTVNFDCYLFKNKVLDLHFSEVHYMHYYFFSEINNLLSAAGFEVVKLVPFMDLEKDIDPLDWNITIMTRKLD